MAITSITPTTVDSARSLISTTQANATNTADPAGKTFSDLLQSLTDSENQSNNLVTQLATGQNVDLHDVMISLASTDVQFRVAIGIRDQLVEAYREVMRMQV